MYNSRRSRRSFFRHAVVYGGMAIVILLLAAALLLALMGYRYDQSKHELVQGGLVQFISQPAGASIAVDSIQLAAKTRSKVTLFPGKYNVKMSLDNYRDWQKNITVKANVVIWLDTARLVPSSPQTTVIETIPTLTSAIGRPKNTNFAYMTNVSQPIISLLPVADQTPTITQLTIPSSRFMNGENHRFELDKWRDDRYILVKHTSSNGVEWLVVDTTNPATAFRVREYSQTAKVKAVLFDPISTAKVFVWYSDGSVRSQTLAGGALSDSLLNQVEDLYVNGNGTLFAATASQPGRVDTKYLSYGSTTPTTLEEIETTSPVRIVGGEYYGDVYITTTVGTMMTVRDYTSLPASGTTQPLSSTLEYQTSVPSSPKFLSQHRGARYITAEFGTGLATYDIETKVASIVPFTGLKKPLDQPVDWLDANHFYTTENGKLRQYEFDGSNQADIVDIAPSTVAMYSNNDKYLLTVGKTKRGYTLQRTLMVLP